VSDVSVSILHMHLNTYVCVCVGGGCVYFVFDPTVLLL